MSDFKPEDIDESVDWSKLPAQFDAPKLDTKAKLTALEDVAKPPTPRLEDFVSPENLKPASRLKDDDSAMVTKVPAPQDATKLSQADRLAALAEIARPPQGNKLVDDNVATTAPKTPPVADGAASPAPKPVIADQAAAPTAQARVLPQYDQAAKDRAERLDSLNAILGSDADSEAKIRQAAQSDRDRARSQQTQAFLTSGFTRQPMKYLDQGASDVDIEKMVQDNRAKRAQLTESALNTKATGANDPALEAWRLAQAKALQDRADAAKVEKDRKVALDKNKVDQFGVKHDDETQKRADEEVAVQQMVENYVKTGRAKQAGIDPETLKGLKTVAQFNALTGATNSGFVAPPKPGRGAGSAGSSGNAATDSEAIYRGDLDPTKLGTGPKADAIRANVQRELETRHPGYNLAKTERLHTALKETDDFKPGSTGDLIQSSKTALDHVAQLQDSFNKIGNGDSQGLNHLKNLVAEKLGFGDSLAAFKAGANTASEEFAKAYGANTEGGREAYTTIFNPNSSPAQVKAAFNMIQEQLWTRLEERDHAMRRLVQSPQQSALIDSLGLLRPGKHEATAPAAPGAQSPTAVTPPTATTGPASAAGPKEGDTKTLKSGTSVVFRGGKWVPA